MLKVKCHTHFYLFLPNENVEEKLVFSVILNSGGGFFLIAAKKRENPKYSGKQKRVRMNRA